MSEPNSGTTSNVGITLGDKEGNKFTIPNLVDWDLNPDTRPDHVYFQTGQLDTLSGLVSHKAFESQPCFINITITGTGSNPRWGLAYIKVIAGAGETEKNTFYIEQWFAPYNNYNVPRYLCENPGKGIMTGCSKASLAI